MPEQLSCENQKFLLKLARESLTFAVKEAKRLPVPLDQLDPILQADGASFVTLTVHGQLRGCIGALEAYQPLAFDVRDHAIFAGLDDPRFPPVNESELSKIHIEVSVLSQASEMIYADPEDLIKKLQPGVDGVILQDGHRSATYLPQVWEEIPHPAEFLSSLCQKMGASKNLWREKHLTVETYRVQAFEEER